MNPKTFVVPLDGSPVAEGAIPIASALAGRVAGGVMLVTSKFAGPVGPRSYLDEVVARDLECPVESVVAESYPVAAIIDAVAGHDDRVVCMTTRGRGRIGAALLGSVAEEVIRESQRPLILVGPSCAAELRADSSLLLIGTDGDARERSFAASAHEWASALGFEPHIAVVTHPLDVDSTEHPEHLRDPIAAEFGVAAHQVTVQHDDYVAGALVRMAQDMPAAMIVMGCHGRHGFARFALGSVTIDVVRHADCPVLAIPLRANPGAP